MTSIDEKVKSSTVLELITVANDFCIFTEGLHTYDKSDLLNYYQKVLPLLYIKGTLIPEVPLAEGTVPEHYLTEEHWERTYSRLKEKIGDEDGYHMVIEDKIYGIKPAKTSISEGLADIYQDLKDFLALYQKNSGIARQNAVSECRRLFEKRWGHRLVNVHAAIHKLLFHQSIEDNTIPGEQL
ncbi:MAG: DUF5063 domain-containing protein [Bacteroidales bacterium]